MKQPKPKKGKAAPTWDFVLEDIAWRRTKGIKKYGVDHQHDNGRDHLWDAYEEALDLVVYLRAAINMRNSK